MPKHHPKVAITIWLAFAAIMAFLAVSLYEVSPRFVVVSLIVFWITVSYFFFTNSGRK